MDVVAVLAGLRLEVVVLEDVEFDLLISAEGLQHGIETLPRPLEKYTLSLHDALPICRYCQGLLWLWKIPTDRKSVV